MRVTHLIGSLEAGGAEMTLARLVLDAALSESTVNHSVVVFVGNGRLEGPLRQAGINIDAPQRVGSRYLRILTAARSIARDRPDLIQAWMQHSCVAGALVGRVLGIPVIWTLRMRADRHGMSRLAWILTKLMCGPLQWMPQAIVACSKEVETSHRTLGLRRNVTVIENGMDIADRTRAECAAARSRFTITPSAFVIGRAARWDPAKDFPTLLDAAKIVVDVMPQVVFLLAGRGIDGDNRELTEQLNSRDLENNFLLLGEQHDMAAFYAACDIVCSSSSTEGFPNTILEALAAGVPVVATEVGGSARILGDTGWLVPPNHPQALGAALLEAASTPSADLAARAENGRARVEHEFSTRRMVSAYHELYRALIHGS